MAASRKSSPACCMGLGQALGSACLRPLPRMQTTALVLMFVAAPLYVWLVLRPYFRRVRAQGQRAMELLALLPRELPVEAWVAAALEGKGTGEGEVATEDRRGPGGCIIHEGS